jgi:hypothetical protein
MSNTLNQLEFPFKIDKKKGDKRSMVGTITRETKREGQKTNSHKNQKKGES